MSLIPQPASPEDARATVALMRLLSGAGTTALGAALGGPAGDAVGYVLAEAASTATGWLADRYLARYMADTTGTLAAASRLTGKSPDDVVNELARHERLERFACRALAASTETTLEHKQWLLGRVIANALKDQLQLDVEEVLVDSTAGLRPQHAAVLSLIATTHVSTEDSQEHAFWMEPWIADRITGLGVGVTPVMKTLEAAGLTFAGTGAVPGGMVMGVPAATRPDRVHWFITPYGRLLRDRLVTAAADEVQNDAQGTE